MSRLKRYIEIKKDPNLATLKSLEMMEAMAKNMAEKAIAESIEGAKREFQNNINEFVSNIQKSLPSLTQKIVAELKQQAISKPELFKGDKGEKGDSIKGDDGKTPTLEELTELIKANTSSPQDGKTPVPELDYPSERQVKEFVSEAVSKIQTPKAKDVKIPTFEEIARGIESLPERQRLDYYRGLKNQPSISTQTQERMLGGGGMGNWEHEEFDTSSATTTITLARNVAANGTAILVRYQGQLLAHGVQYTISGKVITFTFTLQDGTNVDVTYVRR